MRWAKTTFLATALAATALSPITAAAAPTAELAQSGDELPIDFVADEMSYDQERGIVIATGSVEIQYKDRVLIADKVTYDRGRDIMTAEGNIKLLEPTGEVLFGDQMELSSDMRKGFMKAVRLILKDGARLAAKEATRPGNGETQLDRAVYSPCYLCKDDPSKPPLWQVKAIRVIHNEESKFIEYKDAWLEIAGLPVVYTPYLAHPDPTVKRKSGFLIPSIGTSSDLGVMARIPYFWAINEQSDATINPIFATDATPVAFSTYRHRFKDGELNAQGSLTEDGGNVEGHIFSESRFDMNRTWRSGVNLNRTSDDIYLRRYGFGSEPTLTSEAYIEGFRKRSYAKFSGLWFQGLESGDDDGDTPIVLPYIQYHHVGKPGRLGERTRIDASLVALTRTSGSDVRRASLDAGWEMPVLGPLGTVITGSLGLGMDGYHVENGAKDNGGDFTGFAGRVTPSAGLDIRLPMVAGSGRVHQLLEPAVSVIATPIGGETDDIPNEDSPEVEFDDTNLFAPDRFAGEDRVERGVRVNYGIRWGVYGQSGGRTTAFVGQTYRPSKPSAFQEGSGLEDKLSDYVGQLTIDPGSWLRVFYRTQLDKRHFDASRNEVNLTVGSRALSLNVNYLFLEARSSSEFDGREEIRGSLSSQISRLWRGNLSAVRDLSNDGGMRQVSALLTYEDECLQFDIEARRDFYRDRDLEPSDSILFTINFKTLGTVSSEAPGI